MDEVTKTSAESGGTSGERWKTQEWEDGGSTRIVLPPSSRRLLRVTALRRSPRPSPHRGRPSGRFNRWATSSVLCYGEWLLAALVTLFSSAGAVAEMRVASYLGMETSEALVLTRRFDSHAGLDLYEESAGLLGEPQIRCGRKDFMQLNPGERELLAFALNELYADGVIEDLAAEHADSWFGIHYGPAFFPWHRHFLWRFERLLRRVDPRVSLPFWDWARADSQDLEAEPWRSFFGGRDNDGGRFDHWSYERADSPEPGGHLPSLVDMAVAIRQQSSRDFRQLKAPTAAHTCGLEGRCPAQGRLEIHSSTCTTATLIAYGPSGSATIQMSSNILFDESDWDRAGYSSSVPLNESMAGGATPRSMLDHTSPTLGIVYLRDQKYFEDEFEAQGWPAIAIGDQTRRLAVTLAGPPFGVVGIGDIRVRLLVVRNSGTQSIHVRVDGMNAGGAGIGWSGFEGTVLRAAAVKYLSSSDLTKSVRKKPRLLFRAMLATTFGSWSRERVRRVKCPSRVMEVPDNRPNGSQQR